MNRHLKVAFVVAPFLLIAGYIVADHYQTNRERAMREARGPMFEAAELELDGECRLVEGQCVLRREGLILELSVTPGRYRLDSSHVLDDVTIGLAQGDRETHPLTLSPDQGRQHWSTPVRRLTRLKMDRPLQLRLVVRRGERQYYAEVAVDPNGPWN